MDKHAVGTDFKPATMILARAYVPFQMYSESFPPAEALMKGTLFPELYRPYRPGMC